MTSMMMERTSMGMPGLGMPSVGTPLMTPSAGAMTGSNWVMVPRCTLKVEKCTGGMKITCGCDDQMSCSTMQNLCTMLAGGLCGCCCTLNGMTVWTCNLTMGLCRCEMTDKGVCITCTSGDSKCCDMIQACCECLNSLLACGCTCCVTLNNMPVACGCDTAGTTTTKSSQKR
jgi:hypothetical protein